MVIGYWTLDIGHSVQARQSLSSHALRLTPYASPLTSHPSPLTQTLSAHHLAPVRKREAPYSSPRGPHASRLTPHPLLFSSGFTILEMLIVLFLLTLVVVVVFPRFSLDEDLSSTGRKLVGVLRTFQELAATRQQPLKLYLDMDRGTYWMMMVEDKEERLPLDPAWKLPRSLPESIRLTEVSVGQDKHFSGRVDISFFVNGRIEPVTMYLMDEKNNLLGLAVDSLTGGIRVSDERLEPPPNRIIPDRVRLLLKPNKQAGALPRGLFPTQQ